MKTNNEKRQGPSLLKDITKDPLLYLMVLPGLIWLIMFRYIPFAGSAIAFMDYSIFKGIAGSEWVGLKHFRYLFQYPEFFRIFANTLILAFYTLVFTTPVSIAYALMLNEIRHNSYKRTIQTVLYLPYFFSWVIIAGFSFQLLGNEGIINILRRLSGRNPIIFLQYEQYFRPILVIASIYRDAGWGTIVYLAAIAGMDTEMYEAATIDGASRWQQIWKITLPVLLPTIIVLGLLQMGRFMNLGFDRIYVFLTPMTFSRGDIFDTFVYRVGIAEGQYSLTTAIGLFQSLVGLILISSFNKLSKKISGGLW